MRAIGPAARRADDRARAVRRAGRALSARQRQQRSLVPAHRGRRQRHGCGLCASAAHPGWQPISHGRPADAAAGERRGPRLQVPRSGRASGGADLVPAGSGPGVLAGAGALFAGIDHSAIAVSDTERSVGFYRSLGFEVSYTSLNQGAPQSRLDGLADARVHITGLRPPDDDGLASSCSPTTRRAAQSHRRPRHRRRSGHARSRHAARPPRPGRAPPQFDHGGPHRWLISQDRSRKSPTGISGPTSTASATRRDAR